MAGCNFPARYCFSAYKTERPAKITPIIPTTREATSPVLKPLPPDELGTKFESVVLVNVGVGVEDIASVAKEEEVKVEKVEVVEVEVEEMFGIAG